MKTFAGLFLLLAIAVPVFAQQGSNGYAGFSFIGPAEISVGRDDNFLVDRATLDQQLLTLSLPASVLPAAPNIWPIPLSDTVYLLKAPMIGFISDSKRREFTASYQPEIELFQSNHDQNAWNNYAEVSFTQLLSRRWSAYVGDNYRTSKDPARTLQNSLLLLPRNQYRENAFRASISFQQSARNNFILRYDHTAMTFGRYDPLQRSVLDSLSSGAAFTYSRMIRRNQRLRVTYANFNATPWNHQRTGEDHVATSFVAFKNPAQSINAAYRFSVNPKTVFEVTGGGMRTSLGTNGTFSVIGDRRIADMWIGGGYSRDLAFFGTGGVNLPNGLTASSFYDVISFRLRGQPTQKIGIQLNFATSRSAYSTVVNGNHALTARGRIDYRFSPHVVGFLTVEEYFQNRNDFVQTPVNRHRLFIGLAYSFASESQQRVSRLNRDADNIALTEHARLRIEPAQQD